MDCSIWSKSKPTSLSRSLSLMLVNIGFPRRCDRRILSICSLWRFKSFSQSEISSWIFFCTPFSRAVAGRIRSPVEVPVASARYRFPASPITVASAFALLSSRLALSLLAFESLRASLVPMVSFQSTVTTAMVVPDLGYC